MQLGLGGGRSATASGAPAGGGGFPNAFSAQFDGGDDYISIGTVSELGTTTDFSISVWAYLLDYLTDNDNQTLFASGNASNLRLWLYANMLNGSDKAQMYVGNGVSATYVTTGAYVLTGDAWNHIVYTQTGTTGKIYVDGALEATKATMPALGETDLSLNVKLGDYWTQFKPLMGKLDEVAIWESELSAANVTAIYGTGVPNDIGPDGLNLSPLCWWRMGDSEGDTISGGGSPADDGSVGTVVNAVDPGTYDGTGTNGTLYSTSVPT